MQNMTMIMTMSLFRTLAAEQLNNNAMQTVQQNNNTVRKCEITESISAEKQISANNNNNSP